MRLLISVLGFCFLTILQRFLNPFIDTMWLLIWFIITAPFFIYLDLKKN